jgi:mycoredoxin
MLERCGAPFTWCDIEQDPVGCAYVEQVNRGNRSVPTILFPDGSVLVEPSNTELEKKVRQMR